MKKQQITWAPKLVDIKNIMPTPVNYKIRNALGAERLKLSLAEFGIAGTVVCNWGKKFGDTSKVILIDGNSRLEEEKEKGTKQLWVSLPNRLFTPAEFSKMTKVFDASKAGDVDYERINADKGSTKDFLEKYHLPIPKEKLDKLGAKQLNDYKEVKPDATKKDLENVFLVQLFFTEKEHKLFREKEQQLQKKYKTKDTTRTILKMIQNAK